MTIYTIQQALECAQKGYDGEYGKTESGRIIHFYSNRREKRCYHRRNGGDRFRVQWYAMHSLHRKFAWRLIGSPFRGARMN